MLNQEYVSMGKSFIYSLRNITKGVNTELLKSSSAISRRERLNFSDKLVNRFNQLTNWTDNSIAPTFPYALSTHIHFDLVNDPLFPFSPYGLLHKKEEITVLKNLKQGQWEMHSYIESYDELESGHEFLLHSDLYIDGELTWQSKTTAYKRSKPSIRKKNKPLNAPNETKTLCLEPHMARDYALVSKNIDPIHMSFLSAKIMGHKSSIMHGMWGLARSLSEIKKLRGPYQINCTFISPMYLPCKVKLGIVQKEECTEFGFYPKSGDRPHFLGTVRSIN